MKKIGISIAAIVGAVFVYTMLNLPTAPPAPGTLPPPTEPPPVVEKCGPGCNSGLQLGIAKGKANNGKFAGENNLATERTNDDTGQDQDPGKSGLQAQGGKNLTSDGGSGTAD